MSVVVYTREQLRAKVEKLAQEKLGCSFAEACDRIDRGEYHGTAIKASLSAYRWMLTEEQ